MATKVLAVSGPVIVPGDPAYDAARAVFIGGVDKRPSAIVRAASAEDVARVVTYARETDSELAIRCGGHSAAGHGTTDGGIILDLRELRSLEIDAAGRNAWAGAGLTAIEYTKATAAHGLATGFGDTGSVGIGGLTLGGGIGYLVRKHGLTIDSLIAAEIVTADGRLHRVDAEHEPELFWAIRGGGGNFGVATRFQFRLHPVDTIVGGMLLVPATAETVRRFLELADAAAEELSIIANVMPAPPMPFVPSEHHGRLSIMALAAYAGDVEAGTRALAPLRAVAPAIVDTVAPMRYADLYPPEDPAYHPIAVNATFFIDEVEAPLCEAIVDGLTAYDAPMRVVQLRVLGGAMARVPNDATAFAHRDRRVMAVVAAICGRAEERPERARWVARFAASLRRGRPGAYVNFLGDEGPARVREAYPGATWDRLVAVKRRYDSTNLFRLNQNVPPA
jgi:FAD/FMN-containing dehydrogenase